MRLANAQQNDVIKGKTFYSGDKTLKTGTLVIKVLRWTTLRSNVNGSGTISCTHIPNWNTLKTGNFAFQNVKGHSSQGGYSCSAGGNCSLSYNPKNGILSYNVPSYQGSFTSGVDGKRTVYGSINADILCYYLE